MQLPTWDALALELLKHGYKPVHYVETFCPTCGDWRGSIEAESYAGAIPCPQCSKAAASFALLCRGFTRRGETLKWVRISPPVPKAWKLDTPDDDREWKGPRLPVFKPGPPDDLGKSVEQSEIPAVEKETTLKPRDIAILRLLAEDNHPDSVAEKLTPPTTGRAVIQTMFRVRKVLQCSTTAGACCKAMRQGLIS